MYNVIKFQAPFERIKKYNNSEISLYKAVITQAIIDASNSSEGLSTAKSLELEAKEWLFGGSDDFLEVCCRASMEPSSVVQIAKEAIRIHKQRRVKLEQEQQRQMIDSELKSKYKTAV